jgi:cytochrome c556
MKFSRLLTSASLALALVAGSAIAATPVENAINARKALMQLQSFNLAPLGAMAKGEMPYDAARAKAAAANLLALASIDQTGLWIEGSDTSAAQDTRLLPAVNGNLADLEAKHQALVTAAAAMADAAGKDLDALKAAMGGIGAACGGCHKSYRQEQ